METADIKRFAIGFRHGLLGGKSSRDMCFAVCAPLQGLLGLHGVETKLVEGEFGHYWLELPDGQILDPTADQFVRPGGSKMPPVYLGELPKWYNEPGGLNYA